MANEPLLPIEELLAPIPGDDPAGESVSFSLRAELEEARKEIDPEDFAPDDPLRPSEPKKADWKGIYRRVCEGLKKESKDLLLAARLTEAMTKLHGYAGLAEGLQLLRRLVAECWDRIHPTIEDDDLEVRAGPFNWLGDDGRGARFPHTIRTVPIFHLDSQSFSLRDWRLVQEGKSKVSRDDYEKAINAVSREHCQQLVESLNRGAEELTGLLGVLNERLGSVAPGMGDVRTAMAEAMVLTKQALQRKGGAPEEGESHEGNGEQSAGDGGGGGAARAMVTRDDVYRRLNEAADLLERMEPHSPVPYLIRRAVALGALPFPEMMKELVREEFHPALKEMNRELGIKPPAREESDY